MGCDHQTDLMTKEQTDKGDEEGKMIRDEVRPSREPHVGPNTHVDKGEQAQESFKD